MRRALVVGASGVIGRAMAQELVARGWDVVCATRSGESVPGAKGLAVDLLDAAAVAGAAAALGPVSHLFYAAYQPRPSRAEEIAPNRAMLDRSIDLARVTEPAAFQHVVLVTGGKVYGLQWGAIKTPAREGDPRSLGPNFYFAQEDLLRERGPREGWSWTHLIPPFVTGYSDRAPMNLVMVLAVLGSLARELGQPLRFPGPLAAWESLHHIADADHIGAAAAWAADSHNAADQVFNVANGDPGRWQHIWAGIARFFDVPVADPAPLPLAQVAESLQPVWRRIAERENLRQSDLMALVDWGWAEYMFHTAFAKDVLFETGKLRCAGFHDCLDTEAKLHERFEQLRSLRLIP
ncbi:NAD-dependent epimerase/dehydratase family protein [Acidovorax sp.]|uniref:NAD-dependent epimerase/dehydratase family protein n=1 Tax=Acidovorax sp. TaxID=1872122 RepID=UPI003BB183D3